MSMMKSGQPAVIAEFESGEHLVRAARALRNDPDIELDAYMPHAVPELDDALAIKRTKLRHWVLALGLTGIGVGYFIQRWCNAVDMPLNVGGRPLDSIPTDVPIMFETGVLFAGTTAFLAMLVLSRMPRLWSPILDVPGYERTSVDRFWLVIQSSDPEMTLDERLEEKLRDELGAVEVRMFARGEEDVA